MPEAGVAAVAGQQPGQNLGADLRTRLGAGPQERHDLWVTVQGQQVVGIGRGELPQHQPLSGLKRLHTKIVVLHGPGLQTDSLPHRHDRLGRPGRPGALLRLAPLRTGLVRFHASGSSKPQGLAHGQKCWALALFGVLPVAVSVQKAEFSLVRWAVRLGGDRVVDHRLAGDRQLLFPLARGLRRAVGVEEQFLA
jgi:hypothetical protein